MRRRVCLEHVGGTHGSYRSPLRVRLAGLLRGSGSLFGKALPKGRKEHFLTHGVKNCSSPTRLRRQPSKIPLQPRGNNNENATRSTTLTPPRTDNNSGHIPAARRRSAGGRLLPAAQSRRPHPRAAELGTGGRKLGAQRRWSSSGSSMGRRRPAGVVEAGG
jgi:hypothetical protein